MTMNPSQLILKGVPKVSFYAGGSGCPEDIPFPSVMRALMEYLGEQDFGCCACQSLRPGCKISCSYAFFIGVSGVASFLNWKPGWEGDNMEIMYMSDNPAAPFEHAFRAAGYDFQVMGVGSGEGRDTEEFCRQQIMDSIREGKPVLAFGPIGPPESAIVTGYDDDGKVLTGWNFFQNKPDFNDGVEFEPSGEFRKRNWFDYPPGFSCIRIGQKQQRPPLAETYRRALEWMLQVARTPVTFGDRHNGLAAYSAWAEHLLHDGDFPEDDATLRQRHDVHNAEVGMVAEARWNGAQFLIQASDPDIFNFNATEDLLCAAACYASEHALMWKLWNLVGGNGNPEAYRQLADPSVRRQMVPIIQQAREKDALAVEHIEQALRKG